MRVTFGSRRAAQAEHGPPRASVGRMFRVLRRAAALLGIVAIAAAATPGEAHAYCRTTTEPLPPSYSPTRGCYMQGLYLFWRNACVGYTIHHAGSKSVPFEEATRIIDEAFSTWVGSTCPDTGMGPGISVANLGAVTCSEVRYNPDGPNQNLIVFRDDHWPYSDKYNTLGLTTVTFNADTGEIYDADMEINASERNLSIGDEVPPRGFDLASVITHEAGHFFGLAHATDSRATMYASYRPGSTSLRTLSPDDVAGLCAIYPSETTRTVSQAISETGTVLAAACDPTPRHGFTSVCASPREPSGCSCSTKTQGPSGLGSAAGSAALAVLVVRRLLGRRVQRA